MPWKLSRSYELQCAHRLAEVKPNHKCYNLHGHTYVVTVTVEADRLDRRGFAGLDFADLDAAFDKHIMRVLDHQYLNKVCETLATGTTEALARRIYNSLVIEVKPAKLVSVAISENSRSLVEYTL